MNDLLSFDQFGGSCFEGLGKFLEELYTHIRRTFTLNFLDIFISNPGDFCKFLLRKISPVTELLNIVCKGAFDNHIPYYTRVNKY